MNFITKALLSMSALFAAQVQAAQPVYGSSGTAPSLSGNRRAPGANAAFRRAATKARRLNRG